MIGSLCSGYGGLDLAVEAVFGQPVAWHCEIEAAPSRVLEAHWPGVPNLGDLTTVDWTTVEPVDILTAGFPCQPFSHAGRRAGEEDERHLWPFILEAIRSIRPRYVALENVAGLRSIGGMFDAPSFRCVCGWTGRRGRLHNGEIDQVSDRDGYPGTDRDGDEGFGRAGTDARRVWRDIGDAQPFEPGAFPDSDVDSDGIRSGSVPAKDRTLPAVEERAGCPSAADRGHPDVAAKAREPRSPQVDTRSDDALRNDLSPDYEIERTWQYLGDIPSDQWTGDCPACGRPVADESGRSVFRSGMGTVLGDLAAMRYDTRWASLRAADVGAPHGRERVFIVASDTTGSAWSVGHGNDVRAGRGAVRREPVTGGSTAADTGREHGRRWPTQQRGGASGRQEPSSPERPATAAADTADVGHERGGGARYGRPGSANGRSDPAADTDIARSQGGESAGRRLVPTRGVAADAAHVLRPDQPLGGDQARQQERAVAGAGGGDCARATAARVHDVGGAADVLAVAADTDTDGDGRESVGRVDTLRRDPDRRGGPHTAWGKYEPAIRRWERVIGRAAPRPTEPFGARGEQRLSPWFVEWMMGLPDGWVTSFILPNADPRPDKISRIQALKMLGNGVVPQQAEAALRALTGAVAA